MIDWFKIKYFFCDWLLKTLNSYPNYFTIIMKKYIFFLSFFVPLFAFAENTDILGDMSKIDSDTLYTQIRTDVVVVSSTKETNSLKSLPAAVSIFSPKNLNAMQITSIKDLSAVIPNFFIPSYGSKMSSPMYIRGVGARTGAQTVSLYVDNVPYFNNSTFDNELYDIQRVEVLRGTQGTLYGRNAMGGIVNIYTFSPLTYQGTNVSVSGGNYGYWAGNLSSYHRLTESVGVAVSGYYKRHDGFFKNTFKNEKADNSENAGGRLKFSWQPSEDMHVQYSGSFDFLSQGAFPYMQADSSSVSFDGPSSYKRRIITNGLTLQYARPKFVITSVTGYQYLTDNMFMDQDYTPASIFSINQLQQQNSISQEITIKSNARSNYQWSNGIWGFYDYQKITSPVLLLHDGISSMLQYNLDKAAANNPNMPIIKIMDDAINLNGVYRKPIYGGALFHQSTFNNIIKTEGLSFTVGLRLDYEKTELKYDAHTGTNLSIQPQRPGIPASIHRVDSIIKGKASDDYTELLPKFVLKYDISRGSYIYASASKGYKTGGHNVQMFADLLSSALQASMEKSTATPPDINSLISYEPEYSWNYEIGGSIDVIKNTLSANFAFYYIDVKDVQITQFVATQQGRITTNAGKAVSKGLELGLKMKPCNGFYLYANYGFSDARFKDYKDGDKDYFNKHIPFAPQQTVSFGGNVVYKFKRCPFLDQFEFDANFSGAGRIYWNEANTQSQSFYGTTNAKAVFEKGIFGFEAWGKNILNRDYRSFYFTSMGRSFVQKGNPSQWGGTIRLRF